VYRSVPNGTSGAIRCAIAPYALKELDAAIKRRGFAEVALMSK
jgi:hypothetical protein